MAIYGLMPRTSKTELVERNAYLEKRNRELELALHLHMTESSNGVVTVHESDKSSYVLSLYGATRADGGMIFVRFVCDGQRDSISARYFDDYRHEYAVRTHLKLAWACEQLAARRELLLNAKYAKPDLNPLARRKAVRR